MEDSEEALVPGTPVKSQRSIKVYVRRKSSKLLNKQLDTDDSAISPEEIKFTQLVNSASWCPSDSDMNCSSKEKCFSPGDCGFVIVKQINESEIIQDDSLDVHMEEEKKNPKDKLREKSHESDIPQDLQNGKGKRKNSRKTSKNQRFNRPRIMEDGKKPRNPATTNMRTTSRKRKKKEEHSEEEFIVKLETPEKHLPKKRKPKRRKTDKAKTKVARTLTFDQESVVSCLELSRNSGPNFPKGRRRMATRSRTDFHALISPISFPMPTWKKRSRRTNRSKSVVGWARIALPFECLEEDFPLVAGHQKDNDISSPSDGSLQIEDIKMRSDSYVAPKLDLSPSTCIKGTKDNEVAFLVDVPLQSEDTMTRTAVCEASKQRLKKTEDIDKLLIKEMSHPKVPKRPNKKTKDIFEDLIQQMSYQKLHDLSSLADVPLHIEDTVMRSNTYVIPEQPIKITKDVAKLIKGMSRLNINKRVTTTLSKPKKDLKLVTAKVNLDPETVKEWELLMENDISDRSYADDETESKWKKEREMFQSRIDLFISRMHILQGNRKFKQWKGSVVDSVVGVFLTQNVSDHLSSNAFMSVAAKYPVDATKSSESLAYTEEPLEVNDTVTDDHEPTHNWNDGDVKSSLEFISLPEYEERHEKAAKRKNEKTGIMEDEKVDWKNLRKMYTKEGYRDEMHMDSVDWNAVRSSGQQVLVNTIIKRGQYNGLSRRILQFLNNEAKENETVDLEWLRYAPSDLVKRYLLEIEGIGLKSAECVRLLGLKHSAFPVDTNVGRIAVRLGWVPLEPLPNGVQMHQLYHYPSMDAIQKYLWPRLCKLPQESLYELHYQMITFGKVFCTKVIPNCNACPMKSECKYFASAYVSSKALLHSPETRQEEKTHESNASMPLYSRDVEANMSSNITIEECFSPQCSEQTNHCEPMVEFPPSPSTEIPELIDIEDLCCTSPRQLEIPEIDIDMDALKKNVEDALLKGGEMFNICDDEVSKALVVLTPENACIPIKSRKIKYYNRLRTEHVVYVLPDNHKLLHDFERREPDDPSPYLLAIWQPGETSYSFIPPKKKCDSDGSKLCMIKTCSFCWNIREQNSNIFRGTILIPCRTAMRGGFPLNGTYFQTNEVFADHETSLKPIVFPRELCDGLEKRALYCGSSVTSIFRLLDTRRIQLCFWTGFVCMRAFNRKLRSPEELVRRLHTPPVERGKKHMKDEDE